MDIAKSDLLTTTPKTRETRTLATSINTDSIADNAITSAKIKNLTWDKGQGGTLTLGGTNNVNGLEQVKDATGNTVVQLDNTGVTVNNGKVVIKNDSSQTSFDSKGVVSTSNFNLTNSTGASVNQNGFANNTDTDVTGATITFTLSRAVNILFLGVIAGYLNETAGVNLGNAYVTFFLDGVESSFTSRMIWFSGQDAGITQSSYTISIPLSAGTHTIKLVAHLDYLLGHPDFNIYNYKVSYTQLGT